MISILIVDDDLSKISTIILSIQTHYKDQVEIKQASNSLEALEILQNNQFHLLITDLLMPLRINELPNEKGGEVLIREIYKNKNKANVPIYIVGLTQFEEIKHNFSAVWQVWKYDSASIDWKIKLRDLILHISRVNSKIIKEKKETIFVEGTTDKEILTLAFKLFFPNFLSQISIETISFGAGSSWVERQLIIWSKTLFWKDKAKTKYLKAVGLFDNDEAGNKSIISLKSQISPNSAESKTFSIIKLDKKYSKTLISAFLDGIIFSITLEELYSISCWQYAQEQNWLVPRTLNDRSLQNFIGNKSLSSNVKLLSGSKINDENKIDLVKYINNLDVENQRIVLQSFHLLISDILLKLKLTQHLKTLEVLTK